MQRTIAHIDFCPTNAIPLLLIVVSRGENARLEVS